MFLFLAAWERRNEILSIHMYQYLQSGALELDAKSITLRPRLVCLNMIRSAHLLNLFEIWQLGIILHSCFQLSIFDTSLHPIVVWRCRNLELTYPAVGLIVKITLGRLRLGEAHFRICWVLSSIHQFFISPLTELHICAHHVLRFDNAVVEAVCVMNHETH